MSLWPAAFHLHRETYRPSPDPSFSVLDTESDPRCWSGLRGAVMAICTALFLLTAGAVLSLCLVPSFSMMPVVVRGQVGGSGTCVLVNCSIPALECMLDSQCRKASFCNAECTGKKNVEACNLLCELTYGYNSTKYRALLQCMSDHGCLPVNPPDGVCLANDSDTIKNLTNMAQVQVAKDIYFQPLLESYSQVSRWRRLLCTCARSEHCQTLVSSSWCIMHS